MGMRLRLFFICLSLFVPSSSTSMKKHARGWTIIVMVSMGTVWYLCNYLRICWKYMFSFSTVNCRPLRISWRRWSCKYFRATEEFVIKLHQSSLAAWWYCFLGPYKHVVCPDASLWDAHIVAYRVFMEIQSWLNWLQIICLKSDPISRGIVLVGPWHMYCTLSQFQ